MLYNLFGRAIRGEIMGIFIGGWSFHLPLSFFLFGLPNSINHKSKPPLKENVMENQSVENYCQRCGVLCDDVLCDHCDMYLDMLGDYSDPYYQQ